jgi:FtsZ-binding cell division protein ZapB
LPQQQQQQPEKVIVVDDAAIKLIQAEVDKLKQQNNDLQG